MRTLLIDNYDSYTFNLYQLLAEVNGDEPVVVRNDAHDWEELAGWAIDNIVLSPGPGHPSRPRDFGVCRAAIERAGVPVLGVCLGHQGIAHAAGGEVGRAPVPVHGRRVAISHDGEGLFAGLPQGFMATCYHSLTIRSLPPGLRRTAWDADGTVMGLADRARGRYGVQFHPESVATEHGAALLANFRDLTRAGAGRAGGGARRTPRTVVPHRDRTKRTDVPAAVETVHAGAAPDAEAAFCALFADAPNAFWLDSSLVVPGRSRWSFMGAASGVVTHDLATATTRIARDDRDEVRHGDVLEHLRELLDESRREPPPGAPPFAGGLVGYLGYELKALCGARAAQRSPLPDAALLLADRLLAIDHERGEAHVVALAGPGARRWCEDTARRLAALPDPPASRRATTTAPIEFAAALDHPAYVDAVRAAQRAILAGETYEVCLTNELRARCEIDALALHRALRRHSPAPFAAYLRVGDVALVSSSPERYLAARPDGTLESRPIKGTAPRDADPAALLASEKDRAENLMIADLVRNDLGLVCEVGSVEVPELMALETYSTVHQLVTTVRGRLRRDADLVDALRASFPGGSMTGAPKLRTMELLDDLEGRPRGPYSGALGWLGGDGTADLGMVIRSAVVTPGAVAIGAGGAIVAGSDPDAEHAEMLLKARALMEAVALVTSGTPDAYRVTERSTAGTAR